CRDARGAIAGLIRRGEAPSARGALLDRGVFGRDTFSPSSRLRTAVATRRARADAAPEGRASAGTGTACGRGQPVGAHSLAGASPRSSDAIGFRRPRNGSSPHPSWSVNGGGPPGGTE